MYNRFDPFPAPCGLRSLLFRPHQRIWKDHTQRRNLYHASQLSSFMNPARCAPSRRGLQTFCRTCLPPSLKLDMCAKRSIFRSDFCNVGFQVKVLVVRIRDNCHSPISVFCHAHRQLIQRTIVTLERLRVLLLLPLQLGFLYQVFLMSPFCLGV